MDIVSTYLATWNETDVAARRALLEQHWAGDARYTDPMVDVCGPRELDTTIAEVQSQFPGSVFTILGHVDAHHDQARFGWALGPAGATEPVVEGFDVLTTDADGRIQTVVGFLDKVPA